MTGSGQTEKRGGEAGGAAARWRTIPESPGEHDRYYASQIPGGGWWIRDRARTEQATSTRLAPLRIGTAWSDQAAELIVAALNVEAQR